jgi:hypothetical protein
MDRGRVRTEKVIQKEEKTGFWSYKDNSIGLEFILNFQNNHGTVSGEWDCFIAHLVFDPWW